MLNFNSKQEALTHARNNSWITLFYGNLVLDATSFLHDHPGGAQVFLSRQEKDIKEVYHNPDVHQHEPLSLHTIAGMVKGCIGSEAEYLPPSWYSQKQALVPQIMRMKHERYIQAVDEPFHLGSPRMFQNGFFEFCSHNKWYSIIIVHALMQIYILQDFPLPLSSLTVLTYLLSIPIWTALQYFIHRFIFHSEQILPDGPYWRLIHFSLHGIHHMLPMDPDRLVFPPALGIILFTIFYRIMSMMGDWAKLVFLGIQCGYVMYDIMHYFLHHSKKGVLLWLKRYHAKHHYSGKALGYGVSQPLWDFLMNTALKV